MNNFIVGVPRLASQLFVSKRLPRQPAAVSTRPSSIRVNLLDRARLSRLLLRKRALSYFKMAAKDKPQIAAFSAKSYLRFTLKMITWNHLQAG